MGLKKFVKKAKSNVKRTVKKTGKSIGAVVKAPGQIIKAVAEGDGSQALKEVGKGLGGIVNTTTLNAGSSGFVQKQLRSDSLNRWTLGTTKELSKFSKGFTDLQVKGEADKSFYQSGLSLAAKIVAAPVVASGITFAALACIICPFYKFS